MENTKDLESYIASLRNGTFHCIKFRRTMSEARAAFKGQVEKETTIVARIGVSYKNMSINKGKDYVNPLPYGEWTLTNKIITHNETKLLRLTSTFNHLLKPQTRYFYKGIETTKEELIKIGAIPDRPSKPTPVFNIKISDIIYIK